MPLIKKIIKTATKGAKKGIKLAGKVAKKSPPYGAGRVTGSLVRGKAPKLADVLTTVGMSSVRKKVRAPRKFNEMFLQRARTIGGARTLPRFERKRPRQKIEKRLKRVPGAPTRPQVGPPFDNMG